MELTGEILYIEFPWSVEEPSIQAQTKLTREDYSADAIMDELTKYFAQVRVTRFMRYFGFASPSKRVLIEARGKRPEANILAQLADTYSLDLSLSRGRNDSYLLSTKRGLRVAKLLAPESAVPKRLPKAVCTKMFDALHLGRPTAVVLPEKHNDSYELPAPNGRHWMIFPFIGYPSLFRTRKPAPIDFPSLIELFARVRHDLKQVPLEVLNELRKHRLLNNLQRVVSSDCAWASKPEELSDIRDDLLRKLEEWANPDESSLDALCHNDLQSGNFVLDENNNARVVDLDNLSLGTIYSDGLTGLLFRAAPADVLKQFCEYLGGEESRSVGRRDATLALANVLIWFSIATSNRNAIIEQQIARVRQGLSEMLRFADSLS
jgi:hypothetical protein